MVQKKEDDIFPPVAVRSSLVYEEIGDVKNSFNYTKNVLYELSAKPAAAASSEATLEVTSDPIFDPTCSGEQGDTCKQAPHHVESNVRENGNYELIKVEHQQTLDPFNIKQCSAYEMPPAGVSKEDLLPPALPTVSSRPPYCVQQCSAYGIAEK